MNQETEQAIKEETNTTIEFIKRLNGAIVFLNRSRESEAHQEEHLVRQRPRPLRASPERIGKKKTLQQLKIA